MKIKLPLLIMISCTICSCKHGRLSGKYFLDYDPNEEISLVYDCDDFQCVKIPSHVLFYGFDKKFIIANQKLTADIRNNFSETFQQSQERIFRTNLNTFWIIDIVSDSVFGPLTKEKYFDARHRIGVPNNLTLDNSTLHFYLHGQRKDVEYQTPDPMVVDIANLKGNKARN